MSGGAAPVADATPPRYFRQEEGCAEAHHLFGAALLDSAAPVPAGLRDGVGRPAGRRYSVYRNNVAVSLREALESGFPAVARLIGVENFARVAGLYLRAEPPADPRMMFYGAGFPAFLEGLQPLAHLGYLGDVARLELALRRAYHAADAGALDPARLQGLSEAALAGVRLYVAPCVRVLRSSWPVLDIYCFTMVAGAPKPQARAQDVLITRPGYDPLPRLLPEGGAAFVGALQAGSTFGIALEAAGADFDLGTCLELLLRSGALCDLTLGGLDR